MKVADLIAELSKHPADAHVCATWEGIFTDVQVYRAANGTVIIDAGGDGYRDKIIAGDYYIPPTSD